MSGRIVKTPGCCGGDARVYGTRLAVWWFEAMRRAGWTDSELLSSYPQITQADLDAAWAYRDSNAEEIEQAIRENEETA